MTQCRRPDPHLVLVYATIATGRQKRNQSRSVSWEHRRSESKGAIRRDGVEIHHDGNDPFAVPENNYGNPKSLQAYPMPVQQPAAKSMSPPRRWNPDSNQPPCLQKLRPGTKKVQETTPNPASALDGSRIRSQFQPNLSTCAAVPKIRGGYAKEKCREPAPE
jgi:hypothetical protein